MNPKKNTYKITAIILLFFAFCQVGKAQCAFDLDVKKVQDSYCNGNGVISVTMVGNNLSSVEIQLSGNGLSVPSNNTTTQEFSALPAGTYTIKAYSCTDGQAGNGVMKEATVTILNEENPLDVFLVDDPYRHNTLSCIPTGTAIVDVVKGIPPYTVKVVTAPASYSGNTVFTSDEPGRIEVENLNAGAYTFEVSDAYGCYTRVFDDKIGILSSDFPVKPYGDELTTGNNCSEASACVNEKQNYDLLYYWQEHRSEFYEVAFSFDGDEPGAGAWMSPEACSYLPLPASYINMYQDGMTVTVHLRIKGTDCTMSEEVPFAVPENDLRPNYERNCVDYAYLFSVNTFLCPPFRWELHEGSTLVNSGNSIEDQRIENLEYNKKYTLTLFDSENNIIEIDKKQTISISLSLPAITPPAPVIKCEELGASFWMNDLFCFPFTWQLLDINKLLISSSPAPIYSNPYTIEGLEYDKDYFINIIDSLGRVREFYFRQKRPEDVIISVSKRYCYDYDLLIRREDNCAFDWEVKYGTDSIVGSGENVISQIVEKLEYDTIYTIIVRDYLTKTLLREVDTMIERLEEPYKMKVDEYNCEEYTLSIIPDTLCKYEWSVSVLNMDTGTEIFNGKYEDVLILEYDVRYKVTVTDETGRSTTAIFRETKDVLYDQDFQIEKEMLQCLMADAPVNGYLYLTGDLYAGTHVHFVSGPKVPPFGLDFTLDKRTDYFYPFSLHDYYTPEPVAMENGTYVFDIMDRCGVVIRRRSIDYENKKFEVEEFGYELDEVTEICANITRLYPRGKIYRDGVYLQDSTWFTMIRAPFGQGVGYRIDSSGYFRLSQNGRYDFAINNGVCYLDTFRYDFTRKQLTLDGRSSYMCGGSESGMGYIFMQPKDGAPPYSFELSKEGDPTIIDSNNTGLFQLNVSVGERYTVWVRDSCRTRTPFPVQIIALEHVVLIGGEPVVCKGSSIDLTAQLIGATLYEWRKEPDQTVISTSQDLHIPNATFADAGDYSVTVTPFGCGDPVKDTITVTIYESPPPSVEDSVFICRLGAPIQLVVEPDAGHHIQWYDKNQNPLSSPPKVTVYGDEEYEFYLAQVESKLGCVSQKERVIVKKNTKKIVFLSGYVKNVCTPEEGNTGGIDLVVSGGSEPYQYIWSTGAKTQNLVNIPIGDYKVVVEDAYGCSDSAFYSVKVQDPIRLTLKMEQSYDCHAAIGTQTTILTNISGGTTPYKLPEWFIDGVTVAQGDTLRTSLYNETVTLLVTDDRRCTQDTTFTTTIPAYGVYPSVIDCNNRVYGFDAVVHGASGSTYLWEFSDGQTSTEKSMQMQFEHPGEYDAFLTISNITGSCTYRHKFEVYPIPDVIANDVQFCVGDSAIATVTGSADYYIWRHGNKTDTTEVYVISKIGGYTIKGITENGCWKSTAINASYYPYYQYQIYTDRKEVTPDNPAIQIKTDEIAGSFLSWDFGDGNTMDDRNDLTYIYDVSHDTKYRLALSVINPHGCPEDAFVFIPVNLIPLANTFSPNGDGIHDVFLRGWKIEVFNRNGVLLYEGTEGWDGTYKGVPVGSDTYFYCLYDETEEGVKRYVNYVTVVR